LSDIDDYKDYAKNILIAKDGEYVAAGSCSELYYEKVNLLVEKIDGKWLVLDIGEGNKEIREEF